MFLCEFYKVLAVILHSRLKNLKCPTRNDQYFNIFNALVEHLSMSPSRYDNEKDFYVWSNFHILVLPINTDFKVSYSLFLYAASHGLEFYRILGKSECTTHNPLSANPTKKSNTLKQFADELFECVWPFCGIGT